MWQNLCGKTNCNSLCTLCQQERKFNRKGYRFLITSVIRRCPSGNFWTKNHFQCKRSKPRFNVPGCCRRITSQQIPPVPLHIDKQVFLSKLDHCITNGCITMRVVLHRVANYICHFIVTTVL